MDHKAPTDRSFGLSVGSASVLFAGLSWWRAHPNVAALLGVTGAVLVTAGLLAPGALRVPNRLWWRFAEVLGWINARILLTLFFFVVLTPAGLLMRIAGRSPLRARHTGTNWSASAARRRGRSHFEHLF